MADIIFWEPNDSRGTLYSKAFGVADYEFDIYNRDFWVPEIIYYCDQIERWILLLLLKSLLIVPNLFRLLRSNPLPPRYTYANEFSNHQNTRQSPPSE